MAVWPASLPSLEVVGTLTLTEANNVVRTEMDVGPPKVRRRSTASPRPVRMGHPALTRAQLSTFLTFYRDTLDGGALSFDMNDPTTNTDATFRFTAPPSLRPAANEVWGVTCELEILP